MKPRLLRSLTLVAAAVGAGALGAWLADHARHSPAGAAALSGKAPQLREDRGAPLEEILPAILSQASTDDELARCRGLCAALDRVRAADVAALLDRLDRLPERDRSALLVPVFTRLCTLQPAAATAWVRSLPQTTYTALQAAGSAPHEVFAAWLKMLPDVAREDAQKNPEMFGALYAWRMMENAGNGEDPAAVLAPLEGIPAGRLRERAVKSYIWYRHLSPATQQLAEAELSAEALRDIIITALEREGPAFAKDDAKLAALATAMAEAKPSLWGNARLNKLVAFAADRGGSPQRMAEWTLQLPEGLRLPAAIEALTEWAKRGDVKALDWAQKNGVPVDTFYAGSSWRQQAVEEAPLIRAARVSPAQVAAWLAALPPGPERERLINYALHDPAEKFHATLRAALGR